MKLRYMMLLAALWLSFEASAQEPQIRPVDWNEIESLTTDPGSPYYFDRLMYRYAKCDTMLNAVDYYNLYYGYSLQGEYAPDSVSRYQDSIAALLSRGKQLDSVDYLLMEDYLLRTLDVQPFSIRDLNALAFVYENLGLAGQAAQQMYKVEMIVYTIKSSGTGMTKDSPWMVIAAQNAEDLMTLLELNNLRSTIITVDVVYLSAKDPVKTKNDGRFFDYLPINRYLADRAKQQAESTPRPPKRKMEFNSKYNPWSKNSILPK